MLRYAIKMYLGEVFMSPTYWVVLGTLLGAEYFAASQYRGGLALVELLQFITIPVYIFLVSTVFFTGDKVLTFELVMFRDWSVVALGRLFSLLLSLLPFTIVTLLIAWRYESMLTVPILAAILFYSIMVLLSTVIGGGNRLYVLAMAILFMLPFSSLVLVQNQANLGNPLHGFMGYLAYLLSPAYGSYAVSSGILLVDSGEANGIILLVSTIGVVAYHLVFMRREVYPG